MVGTNNVFGQRFCDLTEFLALFEDFVVAVKLNFPAAKIIANIIPSHCDVLPSYSAMIDKFNKCVCDLGTQYGFRVVALPFHEGNFPPGSYLARDRLHLNARGNLYLKKVIKANVHSAFYG